MRDPLLQKILNETPLDVKIFVDKYADLVVRINELLKQKGLTQKELAEKMSQKPSAISRWLSGDGNITLRSIAKLEAVLGEDLITIPEFETGNSFEGWESYKVEFTVQRKKIETNAEDFQPLTA